MDNESCFDSPWGWVYSVVGSFALDMVKNDLYAGGKLFWGVTEVDGGGSFN